MKSAYEIAMERLERESGPSKKLTEEQKTAIAEIDKKYDAKIAEHRLAVQAKIKAAANSEEFQKLNAELADGIASLEDKRNREKENIWNNQEN